MLDESINHMDAFDRLSAMRQLHVVGQGVQPNHYFNQYLHAAEPIDVFSEAWVPATPFDHVDVVDSNSDSFDHVDVVDSDVADNDDAAS